MSALCNENSTCCWLAYSRHSDCPGRGRGWGDPRNLGKRSDSFMIITGWLVSWCVYYRPHPKEDERQYFQSVHTWGGGGGGRTPSPSRNTSTGPMSFLGRGGTLFPSHNTSTCPMSFPGGVPQWLVPVGGVPSPPTRTGWGGPLTRSRWGNPSIQDWMG